MTDTVTPTSLQASDLQVCAPGRTRTCNLRIRSETRAVRLVLPGRIAAGRVGSTVRLITSRSTLLQRPDCQTDCQPLPGPEIRAGSLQPTSEGASG
jgi:hypothetical protein